MGRSASKIARRRTVATSNQWRGLGRKSCVNELWHHQPLPGSPAARQTLRGAKPLPAIPTSAYVQIWCNPPVQVLTF
eukprot:scaffold293137_cov27-Tisochrysis_lutea.AAC.2